MVNEPTNQQTISDDQELAKVLAGVSTQADDQAAQSAVASPVPDLSMAATAETETEQVLQPAIDAAVTSVPEPSNGADTQLDGIKLEALNELRPLVDKLNVSAEEKFDTYLLLLRSTDDKDLIAPAHEAAKNIADETRRAQALLDIIKEIDFLSQNQK